MAAELVRLKKAIEEHFQKTGGEPLRWTYLMDGEERTTAFRASLGLVEVEEDTASIKVEAELAFFEDDSSQSVGVVGVFGPTGQVRRLLTTWACMVGSGERDRTLFAQAAFLREIDKVVKAMLMG